MEPPCLVCGGKLDLLRDVVVEQPMVHELRTTVWRKDTPVSLS